MNPRLSLVQRGGSIPWTRHSSSVMEARMASRRVPVRAGGSSTASAGGQDGDGSSRRSREGMSNLPGIARLAMRPARPALLSTVGGPGAPHRGPVASTLQREHGFADRSQGSGRPAPAGHGPVNLLLQGFGGSAGAQRLVEVVEALAVFVGVDLAACVAFGEDPLRRVDAGPFVRS